MKQAPDTAEVGWLKHIFGKDAFWDWNLETDEIYLSPQLLSMLGYEPGEITPDRESWLKTVHPDDVEESTARLTEHIEGRTPFYQAENRLKDADGSWRWFLVRGAVVEHDAGGRARRVFGTHTDITERKSVEEALRAS